MRRHPLESRALPGAPVSLPQMHVLLSLSFTPLPGFWALSLLPQECPKEALGVQWDSPSAGSSWLFTGAASTIYRWTDTAAGSPAPSRHWPRRAASADGRAERFLAETWPQTGAGIEWGTLVGCLGTEQGHPGCHPALNAGAEICLQGMGDKGERDTWLTSARRMTCHPLPHRGASPQTPSRHPLEEAGCMLGTAGEFCVLDSLPRGVGRQSAIRAQANVGRVLPGLPRASWFLSVPGGRVFWFCLGLVLHSNSCLCTFAILKAKQCAVPCRAKWFLPKTVPPERKAFFLLGWRRE